MVDFSFDFLQSHFHRILERLDRIDKRTEHMALDLTNLTTQVNRLETDNTALVALVNQLLASNPDAGVQAQLDAITAGAMTASVSDEVVLAAQQAALTASQLAAAKVDPSGVGTQYAGATGAATVAGVTGGTGLTGATDNPTPVGPVAVPPAATGVTGV